MSQQYLEFFCDQCGFSASETVEWGYFSYAVSPEPVPVKRELVWCHGCGRPTPGESLASRVGVLKREDMLQKARGALQKELDSLAASKNFLDRIFWWKERESQLVVELRNQITEIAKDLERETILVMHQLNRKTPARCLICGSVHIVPFPPGEKVSLFDENSKGNGSMAFIHPNCGGTVSGRDSGLRASVRMSHRMYDIDGQFLG